ncbi:universal stress protein [Streptomyces sp. SID5785]|uniref:universal stress protein n=1 Tax=Streptomyces sp. SID5785 TaxID=2690309 RepID=UPI0013612C22|nr:universal stress protein [Streptomyces sp. SID5785]MZD07730.1 universal stress protein [Streptomyces sp. SID5785]
MSTPNPLPVVAAVDGSDDSARALDWALGEALRRGTGLRVLHVRQYAPALQPGVLVAGTEPPPDEDRVIEAVRADLAGRADLPPVEYVSREGLPADLLPQESAQAQILVMGSRGRGGFASLVLGSNGIATARDAHCPVVVVPRPDRGVASDAPVPDGRRVVVGLKPDAPDADTLEHAFAHAARSGARVQVVVAYPWPVLAWSAFGDFTPTVQDQEAAERETLALANEQTEALRTAHPGVAVELHVAPGDAAGHLVDASREAELVVVGRHRRRLTRPAPMLGSVTHAVLLHAASPVVVVPPAPEEPADDPGDGQG